MTLPALLLGWIGDPGHPVATIDHLAGVWPHAERHMAHDAAEVRTWPLIVHDFLDEL